MGQTGTELHRLGGLPRAVSSVKQKGWFADVGVQDIDHYELCPGRALLISIPWHLQERINVLNIYAPNDPICNAAFWERIHDNIINLPQPDVILGNFNFIEDSV